MKGNTGTQTSTVIHLKKPNRIACDCSRCRHCVVFSNGKSWSEKQLIKVLTNGKKGASALSCSYYDIYSPNRKTCARYWCVKPATNKSKKTKKRNNK